MKKLIATALATIGMIILIPATSFAAAAKTDVTGTVTNNGNPVNGAKLTVVCDNHDKKTSTNSSGDYLVQFNAKQCPEGSKVTVVATKGGMGGVNSGTANSVTTKLNVAIVNVSLPEFGLITGVGATVIGGGAFMVMRRRELRGHEE